MMNINFRGINKQTNKKQTEDVSSNAILKTLAEPRGGGGGGWREGGFAVAIALCKTGQMIPKSKQP